MKILKYIIFLSILSSLFFIIYRQSHEKGFRRWWASLKMAAILAAILAGLIPSPVETIEPHVSHNSPSIERTLSNYELDSLDDPNSQAILVKTGDNTPSVPTSPGRAQPNNFPSGTTGGRRTPYVNPYRPAPKIVDQGLGAGVNPAGAGNGGGANFDDNSPVSKKEQSQESNTFDSNYRSNDLKKKKQSAEQCELEEEFKKDKKYGEFAYKLDKNGNPILRVDTKTGSEVLLTYDKALEKYYHQDVYNLETPKNFDSKEARSLKPKDRIEYLKKTVPRDKVIEFQIANAKSLSTENLLKVPGFIGAQKEPGTLYINKETGQVHFVNARTNTWRTTVIKTRTGLINLAKNNFHLFPNAGK